MTEAHQAAAFLQHSPCDAKNGTPDPCCGRRYGITPSQGLRESLGHRIACHVGIVRECPNCSPDPIALRTV